MLVHNLHHVPSSCSMITWCLPVTCLHCKHIKADPLLVWIRVVFLVQAQDFWSIVLNQLNNAVRKMDSPIIITSLTIHLLVNRTTLLFLVVTFTRNVTNKVIARPITIVIILYLLRVMG